MKYFNYTLIKNKHKRKLVWLFWVISLIMVTVNIIYYTNNVNTGRINSPELLDVKRSELLGRAEHMIKGYDYDKAVELIKASSELYNEEAQALIDSANEKKQQLVKYDGRYYHIFFHSLILDNTLAFDDKGHPAQGYNWYMTTQSEFIKMLPLLLENDFVLYDINEMVEIVNGKAIAKDIYLPPGKKPLVLSVDDVNYYEYMKPDGFADRLDVDKEGNVVTVVLDNDGNDVVTYDGDVMPILDSFVREHPEFSFRGAKGIVAITGYEGAFGYRITDLPDYDEDEQEYMLDKVRKVSQALRATGWQIANHSYTHNSYWASTITMEQLKYDTERWKNDIMPYVGETNIMITPFGASFSQDDPRFRYIIEAGFYIFCPVGSDMTTSFQNDNMLQYRLNLDGLTMIKYPERVSEYFFDPQIVLDQDRPQIE